jgi:hypothetical protein
MATRGRKAAAAPKTSSSSLIDALKFVSIAQRAKGDLRMTHCLMQDGWLLATDGAISAGCKIEDTINAAPHTAKLIAALSKAKGQISIVQVNAYKLTIKGDKFQATIPCAEAHEMFPVAPDPNIATVTNDVKKGFGACAALVNESAPEAFKAGVLLQSGTIVGTDGIVMLEYWHGVDLPPGLLIPKAAANAIANCAKDVAGFGFTNNSVTIHFTDGAFLKTQLFASQYPDYLRVLEEYECDYWPVPDDFFTAVDHVAEFGENGRVYFDTNIMRSDPIPGEGASYEVQGLPPGMAFSSVELNKVREYFKKVCWIPEVSKAFFVTDGVARGVIMGLGNMPTYRADPPRDPLAPRPRPASGFDDMDDDIPF